MKIALLNATNNNGGAAIVTKRIHQSLIKKGIDSKFLFLKKVDEDNFKGEYPFINTPFKKLQYFLNVKAEEWQLKNINPAYKYNFSTCAFGVDITKHQVIKEADIIHLNWINHGFLSINTLEKLFKLGKPIVWTLHDMWALTGGCHQSYGCNKFQSGCGDCYLFQNPTSEILSKNIFLSKKQLFKDYSLHFISPSNYFKQMLSSSNIISENHSITVISNPINTTDFFPLPNKISLKEQYNIPQDEMIYGFGAKDVLNNKNKGIDILLDAYKKFYRERNQKTKLILFGTDTQGELKISDDTSVKLLGNIYSISQLNEVYNLMDWYVSPSKGESFGLTIAEANACGVPAIGFKAGGVADVLIDNHNGFSTMDFSADGLLKLFQKTTQEKTKYNEYSQNAIKYSVENFSSEQIAQKYIDLYTKLLNP